MQGLEAFLDRFPDLSNDEKLEVINHQWLLANAPARARATAMARLDSLLARTGVDAPTVMTEIRGVAKDLQKAIEDRIAAVRLTDS